MEHFFKNNPDFTLIMNQVLLIYSSQKKKKKKKLSWYPLLKITPAI